MSRLEYLIAQSDVINKEIAEIRLQKRSEAIGKARALISEHELTQQELFGSPRSGLKVNPTNTIAVKYRDPETGATWTGRGKPPRWIAGKDRTPFTI